MVHSNDFSGFWSGPRSVLVGVSPWDPQRYAPTAVAIDTKTPDALVDDYMPHVVLALLPLGLLPLEVAAWVWMVASMACSAFALRALLRTFLPGRTVSHAALGLALFVGQPGFHTLVLGQWALLLMSALTVVVLALRAGHARRAALAALAFLAKPQLFVWTAVGLALPAIRDVRYRRFVTYALVLAGALTLLIMSPIFYAIGVARHDETFSVAVPVGFCGAILWALWPYRAGALIRERSAQQVQAA